MGAIAVRLMMLRYSGLPTRNTISEKVSAIVINLGISKAECMDILEWGDFLIWLSY